MHQTVQPLGQVEFSAVFGQRPLFEAYPLWQASDGSYRFASETGAAGKKVLVNSIPKSGTYLLGKALEIAGVVNTGVHLRNDRMWDFRGLSIPQMVESAPEHVLPIGIDLTLPLVGEGQFVVAHLFHDAAAVRAVEGFAHIFLVRNIVDVLLSHMRFVMDTRQKVRSTQLDGIDDKPTLFAAYLEHFGCSYLTSMQKQLGWLSNAGALVLRFEELLGDRGEDARSAVLNRLACHIGLAPDRDMIASVIRAVGAETRTFSGSRSDAAPYLNPTTLAALRDIGASEFNEALGY